MQLGRLQKAIFGKATLLIGISAWLISFGILRNSIGLPTWSIISVFGGALLFLGGVILFKWRTFPEFREGKTIAGIVERQKTLENWKSFSDRRGYADICLSTMEAFKPPARPAYALRNLEEALATANGLTQASNWKDESAGFYHAYLELLKYDRPVWRWAAFLPLATGCLLMFLPTIVNVGRAFIALLGTA